MHRRNENRMKEKQTLSHVYISMKNSWEKYVIEGLSQFSNVISVIQWRRETITFSLVILDPMIKCPILFQAIIEVKGVS